MLEATNIFPFFLCQLPKILMSVSLLS